MTTIELTAEDETKAEELAGKLFMACLATMELANVELGLRLGLYEALHGAGAMTPGALAAKAGIAERYAQEWLEQQAVAGIVDVDDTAAPALERRFTLPHAHAHVLLDDDSEACMKPCAAVVPWVGKAIDIMVEEFRRGEGAAFGLFDLHDLQAAFTRPVFANHLTQTWLPALAEVQAKLIAGDRVRIAEIGCGEGFAAITIARAYPNAEIDGYDLDEASIASARQAATDAGVADRARFEVRDAADPTIEGQYDLVMAIEMLHDVPDPVGILRTMKNARGRVGHGPGGRRADRGHLHSADQRDGALLLHVQHAALPGRQHAGRRRGHGHRDPCRHAARIRPRGRLRQRRAARRRASPVRAVPADVGSADGSDAWESPAPDCEPLALPSDLATCMRTRWAASLCDRRIEIDADCRGALTKSRARG